MAKRLKQWVEVQYLLAGDLRFGDSRLQYDQNFLLNKLKLEQKFLPLSPTMQCQKLSISLPASMVSFIEQYRQTSGQNSRSQVVVEAIQLLQLRELEQAYREASLEDDGVCEATLEDGLSHETW